MKILVKAKLWEPPNFVVASYGGASEISIPISEISAEELERLAEKWLSRLYERAKKPLPQRFTQQPEKAGQT